MTWIIGRLVHIAHPAIEAQRRLGPIRLAPGVRARHALCFMGVAIVSIGLLVFLNFMQPYLLQGQIGVVASGTGRLTSRLSILHEMIALAFVAPLGALSDRVGRQLVYACGLSVLAGALLLYVFVTTIPGLYGARLVFALGAAAVTASLATVAADYPDNADRGKFLSLLLVTQQLAILLLVARLAATAPRWLVARGLSRVAAGQVTFEAAAGLALAGAGLAFLGLRRGPIIRAKPPSSRPGAGPWLGSLGQILVQARSRPRFAIVFLVAFIARGDAAIMTSFLSLWVLKAAKAGGVGAASAMAVAGGVLSVSTLCGLAGAAMAGVGADRIDRSGALTLALVVTGVANVAIAFVSGFGHWPAYALVGVTSGAEMAVVVCGQAVLGEEAPAELRGATVGVFSLFGSLGVTSLVFAGGLLFDQVSSQAPFVMLGCVNLLAGGVCSYVWLRGASQLRSEPSQDRSSFAP